MADPKNIDGSGKQPDVAVAVVSPETSKATSPAQSPKEDTREWFKSLSPSERVVFLGIKDKRTITGLFRLASLSGERSADGPNFEATANGWGSMVSWEDVERVFPEDVQVSSDANSNGAKKQAVAPAKGSSEENNLEEAKENGTGVGVEKDIESTALRIQNGDGSETTSGSTMDSNVVSPPAKKGADKSAGNKSSPSDAKIILSDGKKGRSSVVTKSTLSSKDIRAFMGNVCAISPSAIKTHKTDNGHTPLLTMLPSYVTSTTGPDMLDAFDHLMRHATGDASELFLYSDMSSDAVDAPVLNLFKKCFEGSTDQEVQVPVCLLVLIAFRRALYIAFQTKQACSSVTDTPSEASTSPPEPSSEESADEQRKKEVARIDLLSVFTDSARMMDNDQNKEIAAARAKIIEPLLLCLNQNPGLEMVDLLGIPVPKLTWKGVITEEYSDNFWARIDASISKSMQLLRRQLYLAGHGTSSKSSSEEKEAASEDTEWMDQPEPSSASQNGTKKNNKKKKKKKKRKSSTADQSVPAKPETAPGKESVPADGTDTKSSDDNSDQPKHSQQQHVKQQVEPKAPNKVETEVSASSSESSSQPDMKLNASTSDAQKETLQASPTEGKGISGDKPTQPASDNSGSNTKETLNVAVANPPVVEEDDDDDWETVEAKPRTNRNKANRSNGNNNNNGNNRSGSQHGNATSSGGQNGSSKKGKSRTAASRKRNNTRKMVREILNGVLDSVHDEVRKKAIRESTKKPVVNKWASAAASSVKKPNPPSAWGKDSQKAVLPKEATMRDILVGKSSTQPQHNPPPAPMAASHKQRTEHSAPSGAAAVKAKNPAPQSPRNKKNKERTEKADQNTAPTVPETLSSASEAVRASTGNKEFQSQSQEVAPSESSSGESRAAAKTDQAGQMPKGDKEKPPAPPLPTLLNAENAHSATSSVASSLEAPHAAHHHNSSANENDVGYHLLDVCSRLTRDMNIFMKRRSQALDLRRRERSQVLEALQGSLSNLWPGRCNVKPYGSCATNLDLPSSDLDVVIFGLNEPVSSPKKAAQSSSPPSSSSELQAESISDDKSVDPSQASSISPSQATDTTTPAQVQGQQMIYGQLSTNGDRVVRLAMELERQPWAVHVKAIPTATVPVIKILADPARLPGADASGDWLVQQRSDAQEAMAASQQNNESDSSAHTRFHSNQSPPSWRGADVVNGLLKVDITFEGPEHGGIGSTEFSTRVINEVCKETGLDPESTPFVQTLMVLKELLAQRRLNEPFSGGLSSYSVLLLVVSLLRERKCIREELERVERQRKMVASGNPSLTKQPEQAPTEKSGKDEKKVTTPAQGKKQSTANEEKNGKQTKGAKSKHTNTVSAPAKAAQNGNGKNENKQSEQKDDSKSSTPAAPVPSSWASIAKKTSSPTVPKNGTSGKKSQQPTQAKAAPVKKGSFADAVAKGSKPAASKPAPPKNPLPKQEGGSQVEKSSKQPGNGKTQNGKSTEGEISGKKDEASSSMPPALAAPQNNGGNSATEGTPGWKPQGNTVPYQPNEAGEGLVFPQGFHDVVEVLCSGETTAGKLLMHFLLFYGQHFDSHATAIDYSGTHPRSGHNSGFSYQSPYMHRHAAGSYDPVTGMFTVDPIVIYDPLEGAENTNVSRSCFAWANIRWVFAQSYMTLSSIVEMSTTPAPPSAPGSKTNANPSDSSQPNGAPTESAQGTGGAETWNGPYSQDENGNLIVDPSHPLLELLLSY